MIEGTRTYKGRKNAADSSTTPPVTQHATENSASELAANPERRELFQQILPSAGKGIVKILRESNLLKSELERFFRRG